MSRNRYVIIAQGSTINWYLCAAADDICCSAQYPEMAAEEPRRLLNLHASSIYIYIYLVLVVVLKSDVDMP